MNNTNDNPYIKEFDVKLSNGDKPVNKKILIDLTPVIN